MCCIVCLNLISYFLGILAVFPIGDTVWTMDNNILSRMGYNSIQLSIKLPDNSDVNVILTSPYQASAKIGMCIHTCYIGQS